jgi:hypothetical protein
VGKAKKCKSTIARVNNIYSVIGSTVKIFNMVRKYICSKDLRNKINIPCYYIDIFAYKIWQNISTGHLHIAQYYQQPIRNLAKRKGCNPLGLQPN